MGQAPLQRFQSTSLKLPSSRSTSEESSWQGLFCPSCSGLAFTPALAPGLSMGFVPSECSQEPCLQLLKIPGHNEQTWLQFHH